MEKYHTTIKDISLFINDGDWIESKDQSDTGIRLVQTGNIGNGEYLDKETKAKYISNETFVTLNCTEIFEGDVLISRLPEPVGRCCILPSGLGKAITAVDCTIIRTDETKCLAKYLSYFTQSGYYQSQIEVYVTGTTRKRISRKNLEKIQIPLPPLSEQQHIVNVLDAICAIILKRKQQIALLDDAVKSLFVEMFGDPVENPLGWDFTELGKLGDWGSGGTPSRNNHEYFEGDIDWYSAGELNSLYLTESIEKINQKGIEESAAKLFKKGSLLIGMYDTAAFKMGILTKNSSANQACANLSPNNLVNVIWLYFVLEIMKPIFLLNRRGIRQKNLNLGMIKCFSIPLPPLELQEAFAARVEKIETQKRQLEVGLSKMEEAYGALMQEYFG